MINQFNQRKNEVLSKSDKSSKGSWDKSILKLCEKINSLENYYTTSSCSGRIALVKDESKGEGLIVKSWHDEISFEDLKNEMENLKGDLFFKLEPCILHVACKSIEDMKYLFEKAKLSGWKNTGAISFVNRFILDLRSTERFEFPILHLGKLLVDENFLKIIVDESNKKLQKSWKKIDKLENLIKK